MREHLFYFEDSAFRYSFKLSGTQIFCNLHELKYIRKCSQSLLAMTQREGILQKASSAGRGGLAKQIGCYQRSGSKAPPLETLGATQPFQHSFAEASR